MFRILVLLQLRVLSLECHYINNYYSVSSQTVQLQLVHQGSAECHAHGWLGKLKPVQVDCIGTRRTIDPGSIVLVGPNCSGANFDSSYRQEVVDHADFIITTPDTVHLVLNENSPLTKPEPKIDECELSIINPILTSYTSPPTTFVTVGSAEHIFNQHSYARAGLYCRHVNGPWLRSTPLNLLPMTLLGIAQTFVFTVPHWERFTNTGRNSALYVMLATSFTVAAYQVLNVLIGMIIPKHFPIIGGDHLHVAFVHVWSVLTAIQSLTVAFTLALLSSGVGIIRPYSRDRDSNTASTWALIGAIPLFFAIAYWSGTEMHQDDFSSRLSCVGPYCMWAVTVAFHCSIISEAILGRVQSRRHTRSFSNPLHRNELLCLKQCIVSIRMIQLSLWTWAIMQCAAMLARDRLLGWMDILWLNLVCDWLPLSMMGLALSTASAYDNIETLMSLKNPNMVLTSVHASNNIGMSEITHMKSGGRILLYDNLDPRQSALIAPNQPKSRLTRLRTAWSRYRNLLP